MHLLYRIASCWSFSACPVSCKVDDEDSIISVGTSSLSGSFCNSYSNNTCKPWPVTVYVGRKVFWTMDNGQCTGVNVDTYVKLLNNLYSINKTLK